MSAVITTTRMPNLSAANAYLVRVGFICVGTAWLRGPREYARLELLPSGAVQVIEGVA